MFQFVSKRALPPSARGNRLTDPDLLLAIAERFRRGDSGNGALADEFGLVLGDLRMAGTWKRTNQGRLGSTQKMLCSYLTPPIGTEVSALDLGASEGLTTLELATALREKFGNRVRVTLADLNLWLLRYRKGPVREYRASNGEPIMVKFGRLGLRLARQRHTQAGSSDPIAALYLRFNDFRRSMQPDVRISLVHPLVQNDPTVSVIELDCLVRDESLTLKFDAVRASNILNVGYFTPPQIDVALGNVHSYLRDGGCLVVSRNQDMPSGETENGSIWRKTGSRFSHLADFGAGSEILNNVDQWRVPQA